MAVPFIGEIRIFGATFSPRNWSCCCGQIVSIGQMPALFSLLGSNFGGDGRTSFGLPNLAGRAPMHAGQAPGLSLRPFSYFGGSTKEALVESQLPEHTHRISGVLQAGDTGEPSNNKLALDNATGGGVLRYTAPLDNDVGLMSSSSLSIAGAGQPHENMQPALALNFCIALDGIYPPRN
ncbi:phage tail protein [Pseudoalteromonas aurantia]|uniref:Phage tail protein n=1 Tax=Pseudoalteromonas aurantia TaxID=43654 RepID=A0A5S3VAX2_9GAMM|nr:tail fiber protein [Pseudoalteromonas aurantia]TMO66697.1 phage tail protein [Pseudoalteromonas aurantia]TMO68889.1 phage tail protein [Pseudoalteromonas aurantia]TMO73011.1 phage tail protein [Pseudoalteromonas aurantia]